MTTNKYLPGITRDELKTIIKELGEPSYRANQIAEHIYRHRVTDPDKMSNLPQNLRGKLKELFFPFPVTVEECIAAGDQTQKLLLKLHDGNQIEMVMIPTAERMTFCLSTQAGCPVGCRFCASGAAGLARNLSAAEILAELFADALNREDENNFTRRSASIILQDYGDAAIPPIRRAIGLALADHEPIRLHLQALKNIGTPLAAKELVRSLQSGNAEAYAALTDVLAVPPFLKEAREAYFVMAGRHDILPGAIEAAIQYKWEKDFLQVLRKIVRRPLSFREYMVVRTTIDQFETGKKESPELAAMEQIKILLMRSGDVAGTPRILSLSDKELEVKRKLEKEDRRRIQPFEDQLAKSKNPEMAVLAALSLYIMEWDTLRMRRAGNSAGTAPVSRDYLRRVKEAGLRILKRLDSDTVQRTLTTLKNHVESEDESNMLSSLAVRLSGRYGEGGVR